MKKVGRWQFRSLHGTVASLRRKRRAQDKKTLTISSWGGAFQKAQKEAWFSIVEKELDITIKEDTTSGVADVRAQVASGKPTWDLSTQGAHSCALLEKEGKPREVRCRDHRNDCGHPDDARTTRSYWHLADRLFGRHRLARQGLPRQGAGGLGSVLGHEELPRPALHAASHPDL